MTPASRRGGAGAGRGQPFVPPFSGRRVVVVVFNPWRDIEPDPERRGEAPMGILENHDARGLSMRRCGAPSLSIQWHPLETSRQPRLTGSSFAGAWPGDGQ